MSEKYWYYTFMIEKAKEIQNNLPHLALAGLLARILVGLEQERNVGDIDFCITQSNFNKYNYAKKLDFMEFKLSDKI